MDNTNKKQSNSLKDDHFDLHIGHDFKLVMKYLWRFLHRTLGIRAGADIEGTIEGIKADIAFRGTKAWILIFSIFIASIGLNVNSTAVVIGAMLISPLMGPILGIGLSIGTNDWDTLVRSLKNLGIAITISLLTSTLFFLITPLKDIQPELLARTKPTFLDVLIAIFGGLAGIVAGSRREKTNVIPGVAIATALMPPLCTAGYGLATANFKFFFGAFYLFFLNSVFISISTLIIVRYLHFPKKNFVDSQREKKIKRYIFAFVLIVIIPSTSIFWDVIKESKFNANVNLFIKENIDNNKAFIRSEIISRKIVYQDTLSYIDLYVIGEKVTDETISKLDKKAGDYGLHKKGNFWKTGAIAWTDCIEVRIHQASENHNEMDSTLRNIRSEVSKEVRVGILEDLYKTHEQRIKNKDDKIIALEDEIIKLRVRDTIPFSRIQKEFKALYDKVDKLAYAKTLETDFINGCDTMPTFLLHWNKSAKNYYRRKQNIKISKWLKERLEVDTVRVIQY